MLRKYTDGPPTIGVIGTVCVRVVTPPPTPTPDPPRIVPKPPRLTWGKPADSPPAPVSYPISTTYYTDAAGKCWRVTTWGTAFGDITGVTKTPVAC